MQPVNPPAGQAPPAQVPIVEQKQQQQQQQQPPVDEQPAVSGAPPPVGQRILSREERVEYRDQDGNLLNEEQVKALEGKVEFKTRYETRTRVVDADGNEIVAPESIVPPPVAPPHPDVEGQNVLH